MIVCHFIYKLISLSIVDAEPKARRADITPQTGQRIKTSSHYQKVETCAQSIQ